jgi:hypothetical protein
MYLTAFLAEELGRIAQADRDAQAAQSRLARLADCGRQCREASASLFNRLVLAFRPAPTTCP